MPTYNSWQMRTSAQTTAPPHSHTCLALLTFMAARRLSVDMKVYPIPVNQQQTKQFHIKLTEATLAQISSPKCSKTCSKTNPRLINMRCNAHKTRSKQRLENSIQLSRTWPWLKVMILIKQQHNSWVVEHVHLAALLARYMLVQENAGLHLYQIQRKNEVIRQAQIQNIL